MNVTDYMTSKKAAYFAIDQIVTDPKNFGKQYNEAQITIQICRNTKHEVGAGTITKYLDQLEEAGQIKRVEVDGIRHIEVMILHD